MGGIHGKHLKRTVENAWPGLDIHQRVIHCSASGVFGDVAAQVDGLMNHKPVTNIVARRGRSIRGSRRRRRGRRLGGGGGPTTECDGGKSQPGACDLEQERYERPCAHHSWPSLLEEN